MGKRFVTRTRSEWEQLAEPEVLDTRGLRSRATVWLRGMLQRFDQGGTESPITLAVPERFLAVLGASSEPSARSETSPD